MKKINLMSNDKLVGTFQYDEYKIYAIENKHMTTLWIGDPSECILAAFSFATKGITPKEIEEFLNQSTGVIDSFLEEYKVGTKNYSK